MKKYIVTGILIVMTFCGTGIAGTERYGTEPAEAESAYARIITDGVKFYAHADSSDYTFVLPVTYYVKVLEKGTTRTRVECFSGGETAMVDGYVDNGDLYYGEEAVITPYLNLSVTTLRSAALFRDRNATDAIQYIFAGRVLKYYGYATDDGGNYMFFVEYNNKVGYVSEADVTPFTVPAHATPLPEPEPTEPVDGQTEPIDGTENETPGFDSTVGKIIIACLCVSAIIILLCLIRPKQTKPSVKRNYYDENDYE